MEQVYRHPSNGPASVDEISIELFSKHKLTEDLRAQLAQHFTSKLPKPKNNRMLIIGATVGVMTKLMEPYCDHIDAIAEEQYIPILEALFVKGQSIEYTFNRQGYIGQKHLIPKMEKSTCTISIIEISKYKEHIQKDSYYDIVLLQNIIVHPKINILKQLMRLRHSVLLTMIVPGKLVHENLFQLLSGIQQNILHVFYEQATHERVQYIRYLTGRRQQINIWEVFVWIKKQSSDVKTELVKVSEILDEQVKKNTVKAVKNHSEKGSAIYQTESSINQYLDFHYGETQYFGVKNFPLNCAEEVINAAKQQGIVGRVLDLGCAVGRSTIQLGKYFDQAVGVEYSQGFTNAAIKVLNEKYSDLAAKIKFIQGDACKLDKQLGKFDVIFGGNLIDRLYDPELFLYNLKNFLADKSILILTSPYTWLEDYTEKSKWIGGKEVDGKPLTTYEGLRQILSNLGLKQLKNPKDVRFVIKDNHWVYQYTNAHMTFWLRE